MLLATVLLPGCGDERSPASPASTAAAERAEQGAALPDTEWPLHGGTQDEARYSELQQINTESVAELGLAWSYDTDSHRGLEATPIVKP